MGQFPPLRKPPMSYAPCARRAPLALFTAALLALPLAQAATISKADYDAGKSRIKADYSAEKAACGKQSGNAKDVCVE